MKKLMIAVAIVCATAFVEAASVTWSCSNVYSPADNHTKIDGTQAYVFGGTSFTTASIIAALEGKGATEVSSWLAGIETKYGFTTDAGKASMTTQNTVDPADVGLVAGGGVQNLFAVIFDSDTITDSSKFYVVAKDTSVNGSGNTAFSFGSQGNTKTWDGPSQVSGAWQAANVPEPTSGLLLVLGMAGLALRRRRA